MKTVRYIMLSLGVIAVLATAAPAQAYGLTITREQGQGITAGQVPISPGNLDYMYQPYLEVVISDRATDEWMYSVTQVGDYRYLPGSNCTPLNPGWVCSGGQWLGYTWDGLTDGKALPSYPAGLVAPAGEVLPVADYVVVAGFCTDTTYTLCSWTTSASMTVTAPTPPDPTPTLRTISLRKLTTPLRLKGAVASTDVACIASVGVKVLRDGSLIKTITTTDTGVIPAFSAARGHKYSAKLRLTTDCTKAGDSVSL